MRADGRSTEKVVKETLAKAWRISSVDPGFERVWEQEKKGSWPQEVFQYESQELDDYISKATERREGYLAASRPLRKPRAKKQLSKPLLREEEAMRAEVFSRLCATRAGLSRPVLEWRQRFVGGDVLSPEEAIRFLRSPCNGFLLCSEETQFGAEASQLVRSGAAKLYHPKGEGWCMILVNPIPSPLGQLAKLGQDLSKTWGWAKELAGWFVISGEIPYLPPLSARFTQSIPNGIPRCTVTLEVEPWVSGRSLLATYRVLQRELLGQDNHSIGQAALSAVHAAISWDGGKIVLGFRSSRNTWPYIFQLWQSLYSDRFSYPSEVRLSKVVAETLKRFLSPHWLKVKAPSR